MVQYNNCSDVRRSPNIIFDMSANIYQLWFYSRVRACSFRIRNSDALSQTWQNYIVCIAWYLACFGSVAMRSCAFIVCLVLFYSECDSNTDKRLTAPDKGSHIYISCEYHRIELDALIAVCLGQQLTTLKVLSYCWVQFARTCTCKCGKTSSYRNIDFDILWLEIAKY